jgi:hypothetical protein
MLSQSLAPTPLAPTTFSFHALKRMLYLFANHEDEVGSVLKPLDPAKYGKYKSTDCITYVIHVLSYAFEQMHDEAAARSVRSLGKAGTELVRYLVDHHDWSGVYINKDVAHPYDMQGEHPFAYSRVKSLGTYYQIPIRYLVVDYDPTAGCNASKQCISQSMAAVINTDTFAPVPSPTRVDTADYDALAHVSFAVGVSKGGMHCWLFSAGDVYEVHWDQIGAGLYAKTPLRDFEWVDGAIVIPPDQGPLGMKRVARNSR